jgi:DNA-binding MarR family transcriptional regulator
LRPAGAASGGGWESGRLAVQLVEAFSGFGPEYLKWVRSRLRDSGMTHARVRLLGALYFGGPQIMSSLSEELVVTRRNVTALVDALEGEGLVRRSAHPTDRRATVVELTPEGKHKAQSTHEVYRQLVSELFETLSEGDQRELLRIIGVLKEDLRRRNE